MQFPLRDMRIYLGGHLNFYHPKKEKWLEIGIDQPSPLVDVLKFANIPLGEVHLVVLNDENVDWQDLIVTQNDEVKLFSAVGGG
jgi:sulfur carrier protein ThiS